MCAPVLCNAEYNHGYFARQGPIMPLWHLHHAMSTFAAANPVRHSLPIILNFLLAVGVPWCKHTYSLYSFCGRHRSPTIPKDFRQSVHRHALMMLLRLLCQIFSRTNKLISCHNNLFIVCINCTINSIIILSISHLFISAHNIICTYKQYRSTYTRMYFRRGLPIFFLNNWTNENHFGLRGLQPEYLSLPMSFPMTNILFSK